MTTTTAPAKCPGSNQPVAGITYCPTCDALVSVRADGTTFTHFA